MRAGRDDIPAAWLNRFLFAPADVRRVAVFRVLVAGALVFFFWPNFSGTRWPWDAHPASAWLYEHVWWTWPWWGACVAGCVVLALGWRPRLVGAVLLVMLAPMLGTIVGQVSRQLLLVALLGVTLAGGGKRATPIWPIRLVQWQLTVVYLVNAMAKTTPAFLSGDILVGLSRMMPNFLVDLSDGYLHVGPIALPVWLAACGTVATEYFLALAWWWPKLRWPAAAVGVGFHVTLMFIVAISRFDLATMFLYLAFLLPMDRPWITPGPETRSVEGPDSGGLGAEKSGPSSSLRSSSGLGVG